MKQQINLLVHKEAGPRKPLALSSLLALVLLASGGLYLVSLGVQYAADSQQESVQLLEARNVELPEQIAELEQAHRNPVPDAALVARQDELRLAIESRKNMIQLLQPFQHSSLDTRGGFSSYLYGLAGATQDGVWLTGFELNLSAAQVRLLGETGRAELVPLLIQSVGSTDAFSGLAIDSFLMEQSEGKHHFDVLGRLTLQPGGDGG